MALTKATYSMVNGSPANVLDYGAVGNGVADDTAAIQAALNSGAAVVVIPKGTYIISSTISVPAKVKLELQSAFADIDAQQTPTRIIKKSTMTTAAITLTTGSWLDGGALSCQAGNTGDGVHVIGNAAQISNFIVSGAGGVGIRVGATTVYRNTNSVRLQDVTADNNGSHGFYIHDNVDVDCNQIILLSCIALANGGDGIKFGRAFWCTAINCLTETNAGYGFHASGADYGGVPECRYLTVVGGDYNEGNSLGQIYDQSYYSQFMTAGTGNYPTNAGNGLPGSAQRIVISPQSSTFWNLASRTGLNLLNEAGSSALIRILTPADSAPGSGTYAKGDIVYNSDPAPGEYVGWICTTAGSPGTWKGFGVIQS